MRVRCKHPNALPAIEETWLVVADSGHAAACGDVIDVDDTLGFRLVDQPDNWEPADEASWQIVADTLAYGHAAAEHQAEPAPPVAAAPVVDQAPAEEPTAEPATTPEVDQ